MAVGPGWLFQGLESHWQIDEACKRIPACPAPRSTAGRRPAWRPRRASMVSGGAAPGERALHACDPSEACKREPCPRPLMLPASIAIVCRLIGRALAAAAVRDGHEHGSAVAEGWRARKVSVQCSQCSPSIVHACEYVPGRPAGSRMDRRDRWNLQHR